MMSSLFIGSTGLKAHGEGMGVVGNNLANANTVGFKQTMMLYQDLISSFVPAGSNHITNMSQKGLGVMPGDTRKIFTQGGFEPGSANTDVGITGIGFFGVEKNGLTHYTRAGNFRFNKEGALLDPNQWNVLGRAIDKDGNEATTPTPIKLDFTNNEGGVGYMQGRASSWVMASSQLGNMTDKTKDPANPFFGMAASFDGTKSVPLASSAYSYAEPFTFYDTNGEKQSATIYYDMAGEKNGMKAMEYVIAMDPALDGSSRADTQSAGLLMAGTVTFDSGGTLQGMTAFSPPAGGNPSNLAGWTPAPMQNGLPAFAPHVAGAEAQSVAFNIGITLPGSSSLGLGSAADAAGNDALFYKPVQGATRSANASTAYAGSSSNRYQQTDGYTEGYLRDVTIGSDGLITGRYSNNESADIARISLYRFTSQDGLRREGNNHFSATQESGEVQEGVPGTENYGKISQRHLEQSNVDFSREFTTMIITQRGFQMNSKVVTTSDQMLQKALEIKR